MNLPLLILRPIAGAEKTAAKAQALGLKPIIDPLFVVQSVAWNAPPVDQYDAIMFTSANAVKMSGSDLQKYRTLPAIVVGDATKQAAEAAGFIATQTGNMGVQSLVDMLPKNSFERILRVSGKEYSAVKSNRIIDQVVVYESACIGLGQHARTALESGAIVLIHSMRAAQSLVSEMEKNKISCERNQVLALSSNVAEAAGNLWKSVEVAEQPTDEALLTKAARLCSV